MQKTIRFVLDDRIMEVDFSKPTNLRPTTTLLNFLRSLPDHKGVKEGCAEGDCGACTVVLCEPSESGKLKYTAVDSCLVFLPMVHGKQVITVENLAIADKNGVILHPVQEQMVANHGSQCGYCTPGIVMALFGIYKNHVHPTPQIIQESLAGNLCRCTGYRPILDAALKACSHGPKDHFTGKEKLILSLLKKIRRGKATIEISTKEQKYFKPFSLAEALRIRQDNPDAIIISGATDIALRQTKKQEMLKTILDLSDVAGLKSWHEEPDRIIVGSGITLGQLKNRTANDFLSLHELLKVFGSLQIRNLATIGGNLCSASPIGDLLPLLIACGSSVKLCNASLERIVPLEDFIKGYRKTDLKDDELLTEIIIPKQKDNTRVFSWKVSRRRDMDISTVSAGFRLDVEGGKVDELVLVYGGMAETVRRAGKTEKFLRGKEWTRENVEMAMNHMGEEFTPISDARSGAGFRAKVAQNLLMKFFLETQNSVVK